MQNAKCRMQNTECRMQNAKCKMQNCEIGEINLMDNIIENKSFEFAVRIVRLYQYLVNEKKEYTLSKQLLRCGTSIGANVAEAQKGQSKADFSAKMNIALKEANETHYWLRLLYRTDYIIDTEFQSIEPEINEIISILVAICKATNRK